MFFLIICPGFIRKYSLIHAFWISYLAYFFTVLFLLRKFPSHKKIIVLSFIATLTGIFIWMYSINGFDNFALPTLSGFICACVCAYLFNTGNGILRKAVIILIFCGFGIFNVFWGYSYWLNHMFFGNFTQRVNKSILSNWTNYINTETENKLSVNKDKLLLFDFYNTRCGVCFKKFPILQKTYNKYKDNPNISIFAVNIPWEGDTPGMALLKIKERKYTFPVLLGKNKLDSIFGVQAYPTIILFRNDTIFFKGDIENVNTVIEQELRNK